MRKRPLKKTFFSSFKVAFRGIGFAFSSQKHMRMHTLAGCIMIVIGCFCQLKATEWAMVLFSITLVLLTEMLNTAIEISIDLVTKKQKFRAMLSKDIAAGAVLIASFNAMVIGVIVLGPRLILFLDGRLL